MPLVFVHGVNVRKGELYDRELAFRNCHFIDILYKQLEREAKESDIFNPYWGDLGASLSPELPFLPHGRYELLWRKRTKAQDATTGTDPSLPEYAGEDGDEHGDTASELTSATPLLDMARTASMSDVIDLLWEIAEREMLESGTESEYSLNELAALAQRSLAFAHSLEGEAWLQGLTSDDQLIERLSALLHNGSSAVGKDSGRVAKRFGDVIRSSGRKLHEGINEARQRLAVRRQALRTQLGEDLSSARLRIRQNVVASTAHLLNEPLRTIFHEQCALLIGDAFAYFSARGNDEHPAPIARRVIDSLSEAARLAQKSGEPLIVIGHSMGGVILCDIVTCYGKDIPIDVVITVGSQFPLFADLRMFPGVNDCPRPIPRPINVKRWINIFDPHDFLGYPAGHLFSGIDDFHLPTYAVGASAHTNYFNRRSFYFHLARRMLEYMPELHRG